MMRSKKLATVVSSVVLVSIVSVAANFAPYFTSGGGSPSNSVIFPISSPAAYLQSAAGALSIVGGGTNKNLFLSPSGAGIVQSSGDMQISKAVSGSTQPLLYIDDTVNAGPTRIGKIIAGSRADILVNVSYDGTNFNLDDTSSAGMQLTVNNQSNVLSAVFFSAGANPRIGANYLLLSNTGVLTINGGAVPSTAGTGLSASGSTWNSNAVYFITFQPGATSAANTVKAAFHLVSKAATVDNFTGSADNFSCVSNPTVTMFECGTSTTCASPTTIATVTITATGTAFTGTVSNPAITAGDYVAFSYSGNCAAIDFAAAAQVHSN